MASWLPAASLRSWESNDGRLLTVNANAIFFSLSEIGTRSRTDTDGDGSPGETFSTTRITNSGISGLTGKGFKGFPQDFGPLAGERQSEPHFKKGSLI